MAATLAATAVLVLSPLKAQKIYVTDGMSTVKTSVLTYGLGIAGYGSSHGISAWDTDGKEEGVSNALRQMFYSSSRDVGYGWLLYGAMHSQRFREEGAQERVRMLYAAPQASYLKRATLFPKCFGILGGGGGYVHYWSKSALSDGTGVKMSASGAGINGFISLEYTFARHWGVCLEVNALYSFLNFGDAAREVPFRHRDKPGLFVLTTQIGISCHL